MSTRHPAADELAQQQIRMISPQAGPSVADHLKRSGERLDFVPSNSRITPTRI
jgi:hypothetical protein